MIAKFCRLLRVGLQILLNVIVRDFLKLIVVRSRGCVEDRQRQQECDSENDFHLASPLCLWLNRESNYGFSVTGDLGLILQIGPAFVKRSDDREQNCCSQHHPNEKHEVTGSL